MTRLALSLAALAGVLVATPSSAQAPAQAAPAQAATPAQATPNVTVTTVAANINISPRRVTLDSAHRAGSVYLYNQGGEAATVDVTLVDRIMMPDGQILAAEDAAKSPDRKAVVDRLASAQSMVQVSPRRVTLEPGKGQTVRLRVGNVPAGASNEYRTHLTVTTIPPRDSGVTAAAAAASGQNGQLSFRINAVYGLSIPVIVRAAPSDVRAGLEHARVETQTVSVDGRSAPKPTPVIVLDLVRTGASSLYGNVEVRAVGDKGPPLGAARGVGVYPEIDRRTIQIPLTRAPAAGEKVEITFTDDDTSPGKVLAKSAL